MARPIRAADAEEQCEDTHARQTARVSARPPGATSPEKNGQSRPLVLSMLLKTQFPERVLSLPEVAGVAGGHEVRQLSLPAPRFGTT